MRRGVRYLRNICARSTGNARTGARAPLDRGDAPNPNRNAANDPICGPQARVRLRIKHAPQSTQCANPRPASRWNGAPPRRSERTKHVFAAQQRGRGGAAKQRSSASQARGTGACEAASCAHHEDPLVLAQDQVLRGTHGVRERARSGSGGEWWGLQGGAAGGQGRAAPPAKRYIFYDQSSMRVRGPH